MPIYNIDNLEKKLKKGDVILTHGKHVISWLIREITQSHWNHAIMYIGDGNIIESDWDGVHIRPLKEKYKGQDIRAYRHKTAAESELESIVDTAKSFEGKKYDYWQIVELAWLYFSGKRGTARKVGSKNKFICSELCAKSYEVAEYKIKRGLPYDQVSPSDFDESKFFKRIDL